MDYTIDFKNKEIRKKGKRSNKETKRFRFETYKDYTLLRRTLEEVSNDDIKSMCRNRLKEMEYSKLFDNDLVKYLNNKKLSEFYLSGIGSISSTNL